MMSRSSSASAESRDVFLGQLVLVGQCLNVLLLDEAALGGFLEQTLGRREVVQMNRLAQLRSFRSEWAAGLAGARAVFDAVTHDLCYRQYEL